MEVYHDPDEFPQDKPIMTNKEAFIAILFVVIGAAIGVILAGYLYNFLTE
jgi:hypothetical protein